MIPKNPQYSTQVLDLRVAGQFLISQEIGYIHLLRFMDGPDPRTAQALLVGYVGLSFGNADNMQLPLDYNTKIAIPERAPLTRLSWPAQADTYAYLAYSPEVSVFQMDAPPARQLVTSSGGTMMVQGAVTVGVVAAQIRPANALRFSSMIKNNSAGIIYLGADNAVTTANGFPLGAGDAITIDDTTAEIWGIGSGAGLDCRYLDQVS